MRAEAMHEVLNRLGEIWNVPVVKIKKATNAAALGRSLVAGDLPVAEITFRSAAGESIRILSCEMPEILVGAGTVLTTDQVDRAVAAGARFIVAPGISSPSEIEMGLERGLPMLKFFPADNRKAKPFMWTATADSILGKLERLCERISATGH